MTDDWVETELLRQVLLRGHGKTICPSEVAQLLYPEDWRAWMPAVREVASRLQNQGVVRVTQRGKPVPDPIRAKGAIRIGLPDGPLETPGPGKA